MLRWKRKFNALPSHRESDLLRALSIPEATPSRTVVVTGGDSVFSAGADITELQTATTHDIAMHYCGSGSVQRIRYAATTDGSCDHPRRLLRQTIHRRQEDQWRDFVEISARGKQTIAGSSDPSGS